MIKLRGVNKYFNKGKKNQIHVINETTLDMGNNGLVALLGPSGSGKTTLLNAVGGLDKVNSGDIFVDGQKITGRAASKVDKIRNLSIGYIFQDYKLVENMTVYENVAMVLKMIGIKDPEEIKTRITYILESVGMYRYRNRMAGMLSGGERQRVGIARALAKNPKIIIADEPTGNLDSANTIEIMNIIKAISKDRLVVLVTHEVELAKFYASRIIELKDGVIVEDYENITDDSLNYRIDNKFYLKDFEKHETALGQSVNVNFYGKADDKLDIDVVIKNGNIYIKTKNDQRVEVIDSHSTIEFVDDHFKEIDKTLYEEYKFEFDDVVDGSIKEKYSSIIGWLPSIKYGFKKILGYPLMKKLLLIGFILAGAFITFALSSIYASLDIQEKDFIEDNRNYLVAQTPKVTVQNFERYESLPTVDYILPGSSTVRFSADLAYYYQSNNYSDSLSGALTSTDYLSQEDLVLGRMPENEYEVVIDQFVVDTFLERSSAKQVGINSAQKMLGMTLKMYNLDDFTIVGITNQTQPVIYMQPSIMIDAMYCGASDSDGMGVDDMEGSQSNGILNYETINREYTLKQGRLPENDYEAIVPYEQRYEYPLNKEMKQEVAGTKLKVVGYYENSDYLDVALVNQNTIKYSMISKAEGITVSPNDKEAALTALQQDEGLNIKDAYERDRDAYQKSRAEETKSMILLAAFMIGISLVEILLMTRASFLSRIKEVGIFRAIGVKKMDIYKMFLGEIIAITTVGSLLGIVMMSYALAKLCEISYVAVMFAMNPVVFLGSIIIVYVFNSVVGLIPVFNTMRKTPAAILARYDVD